MGKRDVIQLSLTKTDDFKGSRAFVMIEKLTHNIDTCFSINIQLFKEGPKEKIDVELEFAPSNGSISIWLVSKGMVEMVERQIEEYVQNQIEGFIAIGINPIRIQ